MIRKQKKEKRDRRKQINKRRGCLKATLAKEDPSPCIPGTLAAECGDTLPRVHMGSRRAQAWESGFWFQYMLQYLCSEPAFPKLPLKKEHLLPQWFRPWVIREVLETQWAKSVCQNPHGSILVNMG